MAKQLYICNKARECKDKQCFHRKKHIEEISHCSKSHKFFDSCIRGSVCIPYKQDIKQCLKQQEGTK